MSKFASYNFTEDFQDAILACLIKYPDEFYGFGEIIKPAYFNGPAAAELVFRIQDYRAKYGNYPNFSTLGNFAFHKAAQLNVDHAKETLEYVEKLAEIDTSDKAAILDLAIQFARERAIYDSIRKIHAAQMEGKMGEINPVEEMQAALNVGMNLNDLGVSLYHDGEKIMRMITDRAYGVMTGYPQFDAIWKHGWAPGWLIVLLAPPKRFKTGFAINLALNIAQTQDVDVLYYACEISQELAAARAYSNLTGWTMDQFDENLEQGILTINESVAKKLWGNVWFKGFPSKSTTISEIKAHAKQVIATHNLKPKAIVIDYAETVRPDMVDKKAPDHRQQADIYTQARKLGHDLGCAVIMPDRCNRETVGKAVPNMSSFQGAFEKAGIVDVAIGLCATDEEYIQRRIRYFVFLNRHGDAALHFDGRVDPERMQLTVGDKIEYNPEDEDSGSSGGRRKKSYTVKRMTEGAEATQRD